MQKDFIGLRGRFMDKYIRKSATFNRYSKNHMQIWEWCKQETEDFKAQNFADFVREKLEWCMEQEKKRFELPMVTHEPDRNGWSSLI